MDYKDIIETTRPYFQGILLNRFGAVTPGAPEPALPLPTRHLQLETQKIQSHSPLLIQPPNPHKRLLQYEEGLASTLTQMYSTSPNLMLGSPPKRQASVVAATPGHASSSSTVGQHTLGLGGGHVSVPSVPVQQTNHMATSASAQQRRRESPLDLSVKTICQSADSSTNNLNEISGSNSSISASSVHAQSNVDSHSHVANSTIQDIVQENTSSSISNPFEHTANTNHQSLLQPASSTLANNHHLFAPGNYKGRQLNPNQTQHVNENHKIESQQQRQSQPNISHSHVNLTSQQHNPHDPMPTSSKSVTIPQPSSKQYQLGQSGPFQSSLSNYTSVMANSQANSSSSSSTAHKKATPTPPPQPPRPPSKILPYNPPQPNFNISPYSYNQFYQAASQSNYYHPQYSVVGGHALMQPQSSAAGNHVQPGLPGTHHQQHSSSSGQMGQLQPTISGHSVLQMQQNTGGHAKHIPPSGPTLAPTNSSTSQHYHSGVQSKSNSYSQSQPPYNYQQYFQQHLPGPVGQNTGGPPKGPPQNSAQQQSSSLIGQHQIHAQQQQQHHHHQTSAQQQQQVQVPQHAAPPPAQKQRSQQQQQPLPTAPPPTHHGSILQNQNHSPATSQHHSAQPGAPIYPGPLGQHSTNPPQHHSASPAHQQHISASQSSHLSGAPQQHNPSNAPRTNAYPPHYPYPPYSQYPQYPHYPPTATHPPMVYAPERPHASTPSAPTIPEYPPPVVTVPKSPLKPATSKSPRGPKAPSRKNLLNLLRNSLETRIHEKQEKEKFQFNHQTWNFHGRKYPVATNLACGVKDAPHGTGSILTGMAQAAEGLPQSIPNVKDSSPPGNMNRIRTKAEKKQLFPNLLSQIEQGESKGDLSGKSPTGGANKSLSGAPSVFDFQEDEDDNIHLVTSRGPISRAPSNTSLTATPTPAPVRKSGSKKFTTKRVGAPGYPPIPLALPDEIINPTPSASSAAPEDDSFWATCDSFLNDLSANPVTIKSRRGGLWAKLKSKDGGPVKKGHRLRRNSSEVDSDFEVKSVNENEEEDEEEEKSEEDDKSDDEDKKSDDSEETKEETEEILEESSSRKRKTDSKKRRRESSPEVESSRKRRASRKRTESPPYKRRKTRNSRRVLRTNRSSSIKKLISDSESTKTKSTKSTDDSDVMFSSSEDSESSSDSSTSTTTTNSKHSKRMKKTLRSKSYEKRTNKKKLRPKRICNLRESDSSSEEDEPKAKPKSVTRTPSGSSGEEWIMRGGGIGIRKKKRLKFGDGSDFHKPGIKEELIDFKKKLRMPTKLINTNVVDKKLGNRKNSVTDDGDKKTESKAESKRKSSSENLSPKRPSEEDKKIKSRCSKSTKTKEKESSIEDDKVEQVKGKADAKGRKTGLKKNERNSEDKDSKINGEKMSQGKTEKNSPSKGSETDKTKSNGEKEKATPTKSCSKATPTKSGEKSTPTKSTGEKITPAKSISGKSNGEKATPKKSDTEKSTPTKDKSEKAGSKANSEKGGINHTPSKGAKSTIDKTSVSKSGNEKVSTSSEKSILNNQSKEISTLSPLIPTPGGEPNFNKKMSIKSVFGVELPATGKVKKILRRNKFKSGFDYIRKKKKIEDKSTAPEKVKKAKVIVERNTNASDIQNEIRGWVLNKGLGETTLHRAAKLGYKDVAAYALEQNINNPNCKDNAGYTPLHETCMRGNLEVAKVLLAFGANPSQAAPGGMRPLHEACENGHVELVRLLISYGADPLLATYSGVTPLELAEQQPKVKALLQQHIKDVQGIEEKIWDFPNNPYPDETFDSGFDVLSGCPSPTQDELSGFEFEATNEGPLPPLYTLKEGTTPYVLLQDVLQYISITKERFLKSNPTTEIIELNANDFLEEAHCCHLLGEKFNLNSSSDKLGLIKYDDKIKKLLNIEVTFIK